MRPQGKQTPEEQRHTAMHRSWVQMQKLQKGTIMSRWRKRRQGKKIHKSLQEEYLNSLMRIYRRGLPK